MADQDDLPYIVIERRGGSIGAFIWGAVIGAGAALLLAPRSGEETREEILSGVQRLKDRAEETVRNVQDSVNETIGGVRDEVGGRLDAAKEAFEAGRQAARETRADMERRVQDTRDRVRAGVAAAKAPPPSAMDDELPPSRTDIAPENGFGA
jgi:gas vesicle protein